MTFGTAGRLKKMGEFRLTIRGENLQKVSSYKYLGVILDSTLSYKQHTASVMRTVSHKIFILSRLRKYLSDRAALLIYKSMVLPYFDYADVIYSKAGETDLEKLQRLQNRALKVCLNLGIREDTEVIHRRCKTPLLINRRKEHLLNYMYKQKEQGTQLEIPKIHTRTNDAPKFFLPQPNLHCFTKSIKYAGARAWNKLPATLRNIPNYLSFKKKIHTDLMKTVQ